MAKKIQLTKNGEDVYPITVPDSIAGLAQVAKTGSYNDLSDRPLPSPPEVFWATIGETSFSDIHSAALAGKLVVGIDEDSYCWRALEIGESVAIFQMFAEDGYVYINSVNSSGWTFGVDRYLPRTDELEKVFIATYGSTTYGAIYDAFSDGKVVLVSRTSTGTTSYYQLSLLQSRGNAYFEFTKVQCDDEDGFIDTVRITQSNVWTENSIEISIPTDLSDLSDDSTHRLVTDTEKATWNGKYTKPAGGIPASDIASGVIPDVSGKYEKPSTGIPKTDLAQGVQDSLALADSALQSFTETDPTVPSWAKAQNPPTEIFWATYGTTTYAEVLAAYNAGKVVACLYQNYVYYLGVKLSSSDEFRFYNERGSSVTLLILKTDNSWALGGTYNLEQTSKKVSTLSGNESDTTKYPNTKAVADALGKMGVISQTQTWTQAADGGYDYTMSDLVRGLIPQANIDLFESAGAVFNASTGYFELNGLTDISYNEMKAIYAETYMLCRDANLQARMRDDQCRTNIPFYGSGTYQSEYQMNGFCLNEPNLEVLMFQSSGTGCNASGLNYAFRKCPRLKRIAGQQKIGTTIEDVDFYLYVNSVTSTPNNAFIELPNLESVFINSLRVSISLADSPKLLPKCVAYMVSNASTATITITLHATAYARATADPAVQAALAAHTNVTLRA